MLKKALKLVFSGINYFYRFVSVFQQPAKKVITPGFIVSFSPAEQNFLTLCAQSFNFSVDYSLGYRQKENYVIPLNQVDFLGNSGALVQNGQVVVESVFDQLRLTKSPAFKTPALLRPKQKNGIYTSIMHLPWAEKSNYHWFLDCLPRLYSLLQVVREPVNLIVAQNMPDYQRETLQFILKESPNFKLVSISTSEKWQIDQFLLPAFISNHYSGYLPKPVLTLIRQNIWQGYGVTESKAKSRIYISRAKATKRQLINEPEIVVLMKDFGFTVVYAEDLSYREQVNLFYNAEMVVGLHGAGLTNILFSRNLKILELHACDLVRSHYFLIAKALDFEYKYLLGTSSDNKQNFQVDILELREMIMKMVSINCS